VYADRVRIVAGDMKSTITEIRCGTEGSTLARIGAPWWRGIGKRGKRYLKRRSLLELESLLSSTSRDRSPADPAVVPRHRSAAQHLAEPRSRRFFAAPWNSGLEEQVFGATTLSIFFTFL